MTELDYFLLILWQDGDARISEAAACGVFVLNLILSEDVTLITLS